MHTSSNEAVSAQKKSSRPLVVSSSLGVALLLSGGIVAGCNSGTSSTASSPSKVSVMLSDPSTCQVPNGPYQHVYVTVTDIKAHVSATAPDSDPGWVDLAPALAAAPKQIDLLGLANNQCFLATLGDAQQLQPGHYQQIRVILADNAATSTITANACSSSANCVVLGDGSVHELQLSSESKTGIKIPSGQIAGGSFNIDAGQTKDLDIDFNTCISIVQQKNGEYRLKPVLHAGEVSTTSSSINGIVVDSATGKPIAGEVTVALEQKDAAGIDRVFMSTLTDATGAFVFCPLPSGTYDVVIVGSSGATVYSPDVITGVSTGSALTTIQLHALPVVSVGPSTLQGQVSSQSAASPAAATVADVQLSVLETLSSSLTITVPLLPSASQSGVTLALATAPGSACATATDCASYGLVVPAGQAFVGAFSSTGTTLTQGSLPAAYIVDAIASVPSSGGASDCSTGDLQSASVTPLAGATTQVAALAFTGCQ